jgi:predicted hydrocarbon binding protein
MKKTISKEEINKIMKVEGEVLGAAIQEFKDFIAEDRGSRGVEELEAAIIALGYLKIKEIRKSRFYPVGLYIVILLTMKELFDYDDKKFEKIGEFNAKLSVIIRLFMRFFISLKRAAEAVPRMWKKYYTIGDLEVVTLNEEERFVTLRLRNFSLHPLHCLVQKGYFSTILQIITKSPVSCKQIKCTHWGDDYHEFLLKW